MYLNLSCDITIRTWQYYSNAFYFQIIFCMGRRMHFKHVWWRCKSFLKRFTQKKESVESIIKKNCYYYRMICVYYTIALSGLRWILWGLLFNVTINNRENFRDFFFVSATRRRRDIQILLCLSTPVWKSLI